MPFVEPHIDHELLRGGSLRNICSRVHCDQRHLLWRVHLRRWNVLPLRIDYCHGYSLPSRQILHRWRQRAIRVRHRRLLVPPVESYGDLQRVRRGQLRNRCRILDCDGRLLFWSLHGR